MVVGTHLGLRFLILQCEKKNRMLLIMKCSTVLAVVFLMGCQQKGTEQLLQPDDMLGVWENVSLDIKINTFQNRDTTTFLRAPEGKWEEVLKIMPIRTAFDKNGGYTSTYRDLDGKVVGKSSGKWQIRNDSLVMEANGVEYTYRVSLKDDKARFIGLLDWDQDGKADDLYDGWQKRVE